VLPDLPVDCVERFNHCRLQSAMDDPRSIHGNVDHPGDQTGQHAARYRSDAKTRARWWAAPR